MKQAPRETGTGKFVLGGRVAGNRIRCFASEFVGNRDPRFRRLSAASRWQKGGQIEERRGKAPNKAGAKTVTERSEGPRCETDDH
jgi:hypothetical protein